ncbi:MAG TPA: hypothetical protein VF462_02440 [Micromonosporaceae bacterium]
MAAKRKKMKHSSKADRLPHDGQHDSPPPPANGPVDGRTGVGRGQGAPQARRYAFRRS